ncbi:uncharacterized protein BT62DRAFT_1009159 [Guyanagaster necrorhizus]|uniref:Uncharacterized protein n=1 Tax=Guyanagaster necrorhizus TaxID=856835 RepID=A0A9P7VNY4_9AGAR|nr:uncharacterized protein BT62DRAFT_1009159 [Guyanagaster necrorhizus MCA 3950]KAG7443366.1 hypothetical protein BT62DRAFT_1009159 [Guyanagaster necrorhizus MCA 3950]
MALRAADGVRMRTTINRHTLDRPSLISTGLYRRLSTRDYINRSRRQFFPKSFKLCITQSKRLGNLDIPASQPVKPLRPAIHCTKQASKLSIPRNSKSWTVVFVLIVVNDDLVFPLRYGVGLMDYRGPRRLLRPNAALWLFMQSRSVGFQAIVSLSLQVPIRVECFKFTLAIEHSGLVSNDGFLSR